MDQNILTGLPFTLGLFERSKIENISLYTVKTDRLKQPISKGYNQ